MIFSSSEIIETEKKGIDLEIILKSYTEQDAAQVTKLWNEITEAGDSFPGDKLLNEAEANEMFLSQTETVCAWEGKRLLGFYILHPNHVGRCSHTANASYGVQKDCRGKGIGRMLVLDSLKKTKEHGFLGLQFNAVVSTNAAAIELYKKLGFQFVGTIPKGYRLKDDSFVDLFLYYKSVV